MFDRIRPWALYRNALTGATLLLHWHADDKDSFVGEDGATWERIAPVVEAMTAGRAMELINREERG